MWLAAVGVVLLVLFVGARLQRNRHVARMRERMRKDAASAAHHWVQCVFRIITGEDDYAYMPRSEALAVLARYWSIEHPYDLRQVLDELERDGRAEPAWNLVRFMVLARLGVGAGFLPEATAWRRLLPVARRLQQHYETFDAIAQTYVRERRRWLGLPLDGATDDAETRAILGNIVRLETTVWPNVAYDTRL